MVRIPENAVRLILVVLATTLGMLSSPWPISSAIAAPAESSVDALVQVVGSHDEYGRPLPYGSAPYVDVEAYLFQRNTADPVACFFPNRVILHWSQNYVRNGLRFASTLAAAPDIRGRSRTAVGRRELRDVDGVVMPVWVFSDVALYPPPNRTLARQSKAYFWIEVDGADVRTNVTPYAADPLTVGGRDVPPEIVGGPIPQEIEARIQSVEPHDEDGRPRPPTEARLVDIGVDLAAYPAQTTWGWASVGPGFNRTVWLRRSLNDGFLEDVKAADEIRMVTYRFPDGRTQTWPRWVFHDVDVSDAADSSNRYYFAIDVDETITDTTIWAYGVSSTDSASLQTLPILKRRPPAKSCDDSTPTP